MTHRHRFRRGVTPRPSDKCLRLWTRLLKRAEGLGECDNKRALAFTVAAERAAEAIMPVGHQHVGSSFSQLVRLGKGFTALTFERREAAREQIARLVADCRAVLAEAPAKPAARQNRPAPRRPLPFRRDIDA